MRRAVVAVIIMAAFTFVVTGPALGHQPVVIGASLTADVRPAIKHASLTAAITVREKSTRAVARPGKATVAKAAKTPEKSITYEGVQFRVPASWPVYYLNQDPDQCVRYDKNAVYIGTPGPAQDCPAGLIGRADTISIGDSDAPQGQTGQTAQVTPAQTDQRALLQGLSANNSSISTSVAPGTIFQNPNTYQFAVAMPASSPWINATYGTDPALIAQTLGTVRHIGTQSAVLGRMKGAKSHNPKPTNPAWPKHVAPPTGFATSWIWPSPTTPPKTVSTPTAPTTTAPTTTAPQATAPAIPKTLPASALPGFDTCTAPSLATMEAWRAKYSAAAIYIGGQMVACGTGNLSSSWVEQAEAMGWSLMPTFVGLQAPCNSFSGKINTKQAASQGTTAANQAIADAQSFGLNAGSPIYYDMEAYNNTNNSCRRAVLTFLDAWDRQLQAKGYVSGVYSSADAAMTDLQSTKTIAGHALDEPKAIWFALWDNANDLTGSPYMNSSVWSVAARSKQYAGNQTVKVRGYTLNIDADWVNSPVARG
jgi:hypothetical protein